MSIEDKIFIGIFLLFMLAVGFGKVGFGSATGTSTYTGYVVDAEVDKGVIARTSQVYMKTHPRSSSVEAFCLTNTDMEEKAQNYLENQSKVTVEYSRPLWVSPFECSGGLTIAQQFTQASEVEQ